MHMPYGTYCPMPTSWDIPDDCQFTAEPVPGGLWITTRQATVGDIHYAGVAPVLVAVIDTECTAGVTWIRAVPFGIDESDAGDGEVVVSASATSLGLALRLDVKQRLSLLREQLDRPVGAIVPQAFDDVRAALAGGRLDGQSDVTVVAAHERDTTVGRPDPAVLMVLQQPWWRAASTAGEGSRAS